ncbi:MAG TPA: amino acid permease [Candidatus Sulfopaludibacter sp.]|jgi:APA family basic amino acid/polyamine antiporter|nr:amino acid permease [Candidatus Sulfopaludibacter sp.]
MSAPELPRKLSLLDAVTIVVGTIIGSGIFLVPNLIARNLSSPVWIIGLWIFTGVLSFFGALAYAELGSMIPATGGQYVYLREAYGPLCAFLCGWTYFVVVISAAVAWLSISFANYLGYFVSLTPVTSKLVALGLILAVTMINYRGVVAGAATQNLFTFLKIGGLVVLIVAAFLHGKPAVSAAPAAPFSLSAFGVAMIACLLSYDGWVALSFVAGEVRNPKRNLTLAVAIGLSAVIGVYVLANVAYMRVLSVPEIAAADRVGALVAERSMGSLGAGMVTLTVLLSIAGAVNGWLMTAPRLYFAQARDGLFFSRFASVHPRFQTPAFAILAFGFWCALLALTGTYESLASYAMFAAWIFYGLTSSAVLVLRRTQPNRERPYRMPGYPVTLLLFIAVALGFVVNTFIATPWPAAIGTLLILAGLPVYFLWRRMPQKVQM